MSVARAAPWLLALGLLGVPGPLAATGGLDLSTPPPRHDSAAPIGTPWTDPGGGDHRARDAERRSRERAAAAPVASPPSPAAAAAPDAAPAADAASPDGMRRRGARERDARDGRGGTLPAPMVVPRIQPDAPPTVPVGPPPRIAIPGAGEPGGPPIALPSCGPAGCFDANGRPMPRVGGTDVLIGPGGRPCIRVGGAASC